MRFLALTGMATILALAPTAWATPPETNPAPASDAAEAPPRQEQAPVEVPALALDELDAMRGGERITIQNTTQTLTANNSGNTINGNSIDSGAVNLNANAFNGYDGIGNFVINTGHNNNLMGSVSVNVMVTPQ